MDENELKALFRDAPGDSPSPTFDTADVVRASKRATARRRNGIAVACSVVVLVLAGVGMFGVLGGTELQMGTAANSGDEAASAGQPGAASARPLDSGESSNFSNPPPQQGGDGPEKTGRMSAEGTYGCDQVDRELATALAGELPVPVDVAKSTPGDICSTGARSAGFQVPGGAVSAAVYPAGASVPAMPAGAAEARRTTAKGSLVIVVSLGDGSGKPAFSQTDVDGFVGVLATRY
ncbi:hypothetical protein GCM10027598_00760 [Amycolatopsis oliviviridis]|uniref:DUF3558 domain-containing protein n=1 Tax=Amycolatopsis oliviviridis TaxID=1471590 RepID=A0ABQ3LPV3_9PSEU|nr:hypothetical protein [Amycolatopsis oliviviridis]GHH22855.1 hypothetical protein GCM10017790_45110 [Amycolatopsis oliviviridis]